MPRSVTLIVGPPCGGKTTFAQELARPGDLVIDRDLIARRLGSPRGHMHDPRIARRAEQKMRTELDRIPRVGDINVFVIRCLPRAADRERLARQLGATVRLVEPGLDECLRRATRDGRPPGTHAAVRQWYARAAETPTPRATRIHATKPCMDCGQSAESVRCKGCCEQYRNGRPWRALCAQVRAEETTCWVCHGWVDQTIDSRHPRSPTVDHVIQLRDGGEPHDRNNLRLAHRNCNTVRANQLRGKNNARRGFIATDISSI